MVRLQDKIRTNPKKGGISHDEDSRDDVPRILYRERHCIVVYKPARLLTAGDHSGDPHLLDWVKQVQAGYLKEKRELKDAASGEVAGESDISPHAPGPTPKPHGNAGQLSPQPFVAPVHFLDRPVSGAVVFALSTKGASRLSAQFRERRIEKRYLAILEDTSGSVKDRRSTASAGVSSDSVSDCFSDSSWEVWVDDVVKDPKTNTVRVVNAKSGKAPGLKTQRCELQIRTLRTIHINRKGQTIGKTQISRTIGSRESIGGQSEREFPGESSQKIIYKLVEIKLGTGRSHQIRVQCAHRGMPLVGDFKYGAKTGLLPQALHGSIGLHAYFLGFKLPVGDQDVKVYAPVPQRWIQVFGEDSFKGFEPFLSG